MIPLQCFFLCMIHTVVVIHRKFARGCRCGSLPMATTSVWFSRGSHSSHRRNRIYAQLGAPNRADSDSARSRRIFDISWCSRKWLHTTDILSNRIALSPICIKDCLFSILAILIEIRLIKDAQPHENVNRWGILGLSLTWSITHSRTRQMTLELHDIR